MIEYVIIKRNCKFQSLNMDLKRNAERRKQQGVIMLTSEACMNPPPVVPLLIHCFQPLVFD